jgi:predicted nucleotidyltransferase
MYRMANGGNTGVARTVTVTETLQDIVRLLVDAAHPTKIILFGSHARGEQTPDSDLDLIVVLPRTTDRFTEMVRLRRALKPIRMPIDILVYSEEEVASRGHYIGTALHEALREGRVLYAAG